MQEQTSGMKMVEGKLAQNIDRVTYFSAKLEDLLFRAQRIAANAKNGIKSTDSMFGYDLQSFRRQLSSFAHEVGALPTMVSALDRTAHYEEEAFKRAQSLMRVADRLAKSVRSLHDMALLAHQHIREAEHKVEAWQMAMEIEQMVDKARSIPTIANKIVLKVMAAPPAPPTGQPPATTRPPTSGQNP